MRRHPYHSNHKDHSVDQLPQQVLLIDPGRLSSLFSYGDIREYLLLMHEVSFAYFRSNFLVLALVKGLYH